MKNQKNKVIQVLSILLVFIIWTIFSYMIKSEILFPSPITTLGVLGELIKDPTTYIIIFCTILRLLLGIGLAFLLAIILGVLALKYKNTKELFKPYLHIIMATPIMSFILLALIWFNEQSVPIFICFLVSFPIIYNNIIGGIENINSNLLDMAKIYNIKRTKILTDIYLPSILYYIIYAMKSAFGIGWKAVIVAEVISQPNFSIGAKLYDAKVMLDTISIFAWTFIIIMFSFLFEVILNKLEKRLSVYK